MYAAPGGKVERLARTVRGWGKPLYCLEDPANAGLEGFGARPHRSRQRGGRRVRSVKGATFLVVPISARQQIFGLSNGMATGITVQFHAARARCCLKHSQHCPPLQKRIAAESDYCHSSVRVAIAIAGYFRAPWVNGERRRLTLGRVLRNIRSAKG